MTEDFDKKNNAASIEPAAAIHLATIITAFTSSMNSPLANPPRKLMIKPFEWLFMYITSFRLGFLMAKAIT